jgi:hypothetical protein
MAYTPHLIANFATGLNNRMQPWLSPDDAQLELLDGFVYRGVMSKRAGYEYFATGQQGGSAYTESRITHAGGHPGNPVMMIANFIDATNTNTLIVADTQYVNRYNPTTNVFVDITVTPYTGSKFNFFKWTNYADAASNPRLIFTNNVDPIQQYNLAGSGVVAVYQPQVSTTPSAVYINAALLVFTLKDRLIFLRTTEGPLAGGGTIQPRRIRISGTGANSDVFLNTATGAGFIDIPGGAWIMGADQNRDDLIIFTSDSTWALQFTGNDTTPFVLKLLDGTRGSGAPYAAITYLNRTTALSPNGLIITDGYRVEREDENIPDFSFNEIDGLNFELCFAGSVDADRDHYLIYPTPAQTAGSEISTRILVTNYDEDNFSIYRLPLSCMGTFISTHSVTWADLTPANGFATWDDMAEKYGDWNSFSYNSGAPFSLGGGHNGEIWRLNVDGIEDNPVRVYNITIIDTFTIEVTTDFNNYGLNAFDPLLGADYITFDGVGGMQEVNGQQYALITRVSGTVFRVNVPEGTANFTAYTSGGMASRVIPFSSTFKKFNPYVQEGKKVRCGWIYMYVDVTGTNLVRKVIITGASNTNPAVITTNVNHNFHNGDEISFFGIGGMTQLNGTTAAITVLSGNTFSLNGIDARAFGTYTSGGHATVEVPAQMSIDIITNDELEPVEVDNPSNDPFKGTCTNLIFENGSKKWYRVFINQTGQFIQFRLRNNQAGAKINVQATMLGFQPVGRLV